MTDLEWDKTWDRLEKQILYANARIISFEAELAELEAERDKLRKALQNSRLKFTYVTHTNGGPMTYGVALLDNETLSIDEFNARIKKELNGHGLSSKETKDSFGGKFLEASHQAIELLSRGNKIEGLKAELEKSRKACRYGLSEVKCADEAIGELEAERDELRKVCQNVVKIQTGIIMQNTTPCIIVSQPEWDKLKNHAKEVIGHD